MPDAAALLEERGLSADGDEVLVRRELLASGKGRATVNGALVPVSLLRDLASRLTVIHGQHEPQGLLDPSTHVDLLDHFAGTGDGRPLAEYFRDLRAAEAALERLRGDRREAERRREMLEFQATEIERASLAPGEEEALRVEKARQANAGRLASLSGEAYALLYDDEGAALSRLGQVFRRVEELAAIDPSFQAFLEARAAALAPLEDLALRLRDYHDELEVSPGRLDEIEARLAILERLKKKYGATVDEVLAFGARCRARARGCRLAGGAGAGARGAARAAGRDLPRARAGALEEAAGGRARAAEAGGGGARAARDGEDPVRGGRSRRPTRTRPSTPPSGRSAGSSGPSSCCPRTPARSCGRSRGSPREASCRGSCWA